MGSRPSSFLKTAIKLIWKTKTGMSLHMAHYWRKINFQMGIKEDVRTLLAFSLYCVMFIFIEVYWYFIFMHAKSLQSCLTLCNSMDCSQSGSSVHRILQERILEWVAISFSRRSSWTRSFMSPALAIGFFTTSAIWEAHWYFDGGLVTKSWPTLTIPRTVDRQASLSMGFFRQEYWSGLPFPFPGDLPDPGIKSRSPALQADSSPI